MANEANMPGKPLASGPERLVVHSPRQAEGPAAKILRAGSEDIHIGENTTFEGSFETRGTIFVDGQLTKARVQASQLSVGPRGKLEGEVAVSRAEIGGAFSGRITVTSELVLRSTARVEGEIACAELVTHRGATLRAQVASRTGETVDPSAPVAAGLVSGGLRQRSWGHTTALGGAFALGALVAIGGVGTFLLLRLAPLVVP